MKCCSLSLCFSCCFSQSILIYNNEGVAYEKNCFSVAMSFVSERVYIIYIRSRAKGGSLWSLSKWENAYIYQK